MFYAYFQNFMKHEFESSLTILYISDFLLIESEFGFNEFEPRLKSQKTGFNWAPA